MGGSDYASCMELLGLEFGLALPIRTRSWSAGFVPDALQVASFFSCRPSVHSSFVSAYVTGRRW